MFSVVVDNGVKRSAFSKQTDGEPEVTSFGCKGYHHRKPLHVQDYMDKVM